MHMKKTAGRVGFLAGIFTAQERTALVFLLGVGLFGLGVTAWQRILPAAAVAGPALAPVAVNRSGAEELAALPGIGPKLAKRIAEERGRGGLFLTLEDLKRVKGITSKTLERMKGHVRFD